MACDLYPTEGFSHFVTSMTAPIASGWSIFCWAGLVPTKKSCLSTTQAKLGYSDSHTIRK
jgi:hypothetical protein